MSILGSIQKQVREIDSYDISYASYLSSRPGVTVVSNTVEVSPVGMVVSSDLYDGNKVKVTYSSGIDNTIFKVTVLATTSAGMVLEDEVLISVKNL